MKKLVWIIPVIMAIGIFAFIVKNKAVPQKNEGVETVKKVEYYNTKKIDVPLYIESFGEVVSAREFKVISSVSGDIIYLNDKFHDGELIKKGEVLVKIDPKEYQLRVKKLQAEIMNIKAKITQEEVTLQSAKTSLDIEKNRLIIEESEYDRYKKTERYLSVSALRKQENQMLSQRKIVENLEGDIKLRPLKIDALRESLNSLQYELEITNINVEDCTILMPYDGIIYATSAQIGEFLNKSTLLAKIYDNTKMEIKVSIPVNALKDVVSYHNIKAKAYSKSLNKKYTLHFARIAETIDQKTQTLDVIFRFDEVVLKGLFLDVRLHVGELHNQIIIPRNVYQNGKVYISKEGRLASQAVEIISSQKNFYVVTGLKTDEKVVLTRIVPAIDGIKLISVPKDGYIQELLKVHHD